MHDTNSERRLYARVPVEFTAILNGGTVEESCKVLDFSQGGVRFACAETLKISDLVDLEITGLGQFHGTVAWQEADKVGLSFCAPGSAQLSTGKSSLTGMDPF